MKHHKYETHCHTSEVSVCGHLPARELVELYLAAGYAGLVITDHFSFATFAARESLSWPDKVEHFLTGYRKACEAAQGRLDILLGMELHFRENDNDYLIFGLTEELLHQVPMDLRLMGLAGFRKYAQLNNLLIYQAHPFRSGMTIINPQLLDGLEVLNSHPRHDSRNEIAAQWAERFNLAPIGGSDCHQAVDVAGSGIATSRRLEGMADLLQVLRQRDFTIINR